MGLKNLPILPDENGGCEVETTYLAERNAIETEEQLKIFVHRWKPLWLLSNKERILPEEQQLIDETFDPIATFACFKVLRQKDTCQHITEDEHSSCPATHIMLPYPLMIAHFVANQYGIPKDIALIQSFGGIGDQP